MQASYSALLALSALLATTAANQALAFDAAKLEVALTTRACLARDTPPQVAGAPAGSGAAPGGEP